MSITAISYDWGFEPTIVRITTTDSLATITTAAYWTGQSTVIEALNNGAFTFPEGCLVAINYSDGEGFFTFSVADQAFVAETIPGSLSSTLTEARVFVGSALNVATGVAMSGDIEIIADGTTAIGAGVIVNADVAASAALALSKLEPMVSGTIMVGSAAAVATEVAMSGDVAIIASGATTIQAGAIDLAMLSSGITPSSIVVFAGQPTTAGGAAAEVITVTGAAATDLAFVQMVDDGTNNTTIISAAVTLNTLTVTFSADPGADAVINYQLLRAAA